MDDLSHHALTRSRRRSPTLIAAALLLLLATFLGTAITVIVLTTTDEVQSVDRAGRQRMLSQRIAFDVDAVRRGEASARAEFAQSASEFVATQRALDASSSDVPLASEAAAYVRAAEIAIAAPGSAERYTTFLDKRLPMLDRLEAAVAARVARDKVKRMRFVALVIFSFGLLAIAIVAAWRVVVRPFEKSLLSERERFGSLFELNPDSVIMLDRSGKAIRANAATHRLLGYGESEMENLSLGRIVAQERRKDAEASFERLLRGREVTYETTFVAKDGRHILVSGRAVPIIGGGRVVGMFSVNRDITAERKRALQHDMLATALDNAGDLVLMTDATPVARGGPLITYANRAFLAEFRYELAEIVGKTPAMFYGPGTNRTVVARIANDITQGQPAGSTFLAYRRDGTAFHIEIHGRPIRDEEAAVTGWVAVGRDVSVRRKSDEELLALRSAVDEANDRVIVYAVDPTGRRRGSRPMYVNAAAVRSSGYSEADLMRQPLRVSKASEADLASLFETIARGTPVRTRLERVRADGTMYWGEIDARPVFDPSGTLTHWISIERDVSESVRREFELAAEKATLDALLAVVRRMFATFTNEDLENIMFAGVQTIFGAAATIHEDAGDDALLQVATRGGGVAFDSMERRAAFAVPTLHVGRRPVIVDISDIPDDRATQNDMYAMQLFAETFVAATYNVALYDELSARREAIGEINQTKSDLIAMLAHDLKNPLTTISGYAELVQEGALAGDDAAQAMRPIIKAVQRLTDLANDTLALARLERNDLDIEMNALEYRSLVSAVVAQHRDERPINFDVPESSLQGVGDAPRLRQVFENLLSNAIKYSPSGAAIDVALGSDERFMSFTVADRGIGIPDDEKGYVFERFARASNAQSSKISGTGFGLYLVRAIVEQHGGTVTVHDREGGGTVFTVRIPRRVQAQSELTPAVVVVDPSGDVASTAAQLLRDDGFRTRVVRRIAQVPTAVERSDAKLVILDVDAIARAEQCRPSDVRGSGWTVPTLILAVQPRDISLAASATLAKPYLETDFRALVHELCNGPSPTERQRTG
jgi:PAS domain S-box-containing protein